MQSKLTIDASELDGSASADEALTVVETSSSVPLDVTGGGGIDIISGGAGNDTIAGGAGNDAIDGQGGLDTIDAGAGNDTVTLVHLLIILLLMVRILSMVALVLTVLFSQVLKPYSCKSFNNFKY